MIISPDSLLYQDGIYIWTPKRCTDAWDQSFQILKDALKSGAFKKVFFLTGLPGAGKSTWTANNLSEDSIYFDATLLSVKARRKVLSIVKGYNVIKISVFVNTDILICKERNSKRTKDRIVPSNTIDQMKLSIIQPSLEEGFDEIIVV